jgi:hypothetical protein
MTPLGKTIFAALSLALLVGGAVVVRHERTSAPSSAQIPPAQMAQAPAPETVLEPPKTLSADAGTSEEEPLPEDGSGS